MSKSPFPGRGPDPIVLERIVAMLGSHFEEEQRAMPLGSRAVGLASTIRFRAARACEWVTVHVQKSSVGSTQGLFARGFGRLGTDGLYARSLGIGASGLEYDASGAVSSTRIDCRQDRQQEHAISRDGSSQYIAYLIPEFLEPDGSYTKFDGVDAEDQMAFIDLGV